MEVLQGVPARPGVAIAAAARISAEFGIPSLAPLRLRRIGERLRSFGVESPEPEHAILVGETIPPGFWLSPIPGLQIVGAAAQGSGALSPLPDFPVVTGLDPRLLAAIEEDDILIVDGDRGRVYLSPDAATVARYQAPFTLVRRFFLEAGHLPARTASDNRIITVLSPTPTLRAIEAAMEAGADGIVIPALNDFLGSDSLAQTAGEQVAVLLDVMHRVGGQSVFLTLPPERLALTALSRGAAAGPLHVVLEDYEELPELMMRLGEIEAYLEEQDLLFGRVHFEASVLASDENAPLPETLEEWAGLFVSGSLWEAPLEHLLRIAGQARTAGKPATLPLDGDAWTQALSDALGMGYSRLVVPATVVADVKDVIREL